MRLESDLSGICSAKDDYEHPDLGNVLIDPANGLAVATDGHRLMTSVVVVEDDEREGGPFLLSADTVRAIMKRRNGFRGTFARFGVPGAVDDCVKFGTSDGVVTAEVHPIGAFPIGWRSCVPARLQPDDPDRIRIALDPFYLASMATAAGLSAKDGPARTIIEFKRDSLQAFHVSFGTSRAGEGFLTQVDPADVAEDTQTGSEPRVAILMPCKVHPD